MKTTFVLARTTSLYRSGWITTATLRFIPGETGCLKVFGCSHFGGLFPQSGVFSSLQCWILEWELCCGAHDIIGCK
jgi:hypothetical protein